jgi:excisionase family DNA binding protein
MPIILNQQTFYLIAEACEMAGTSRTTILRWIREGRFSDVGLRDRNGWRLFTQDDVERLKAEVNRMILVKQA